MIEAMKQALEALEWNLPVIEDYGDKEQLNRQHRAITALRTALRTAIAAAEKQEPVAQGSIQHLKLMMEHSAWDGVIQLSDALANIDEFYTTTPAQPAKQEPVGQLQEEAYGRGQVFWFNKPADQSMLYTAPPAAQRQWVGLTDEEVTKLCENAKSHYQTWGMFVRAIEAKLKEKNHG